MLYFIVLVLLCLIYHIFLMNFGYTDYTRICFYKIFFERKLLFNILYILSYSTSHKLILNSFDYCLQIFRFLLQKEKYRPPNIDWNYFTF